MASLTKQLIRVVFLALLLANTFTSSNSSDVIGTLNDEQLQQLSNIFRQLNSYFDLSMIRNAQTKDSSQFNQVNLTSQKTPFKKENIPIHERSASHSPWYCNSVVAWKDLGNMHYPRFVKEIRCSGNSCMHGFYNCGPSQYPLRVLSAKGESRTISQNVEDSFLPPGLRQNWTLTEIDISVACICGN